MKVLWLYVALFLVAGIAVGESNKIYIITFGDSRFCSKEAFFCKPIVVNAPDPISAVVKAGITIWTIKEYRDAIKLCETKQPAERCKETFSLSDAVVK